MLDHVSHTPFSETPDQSPAAGPLEPGSVFPPWAGSLSLMEVKMSPLPVVSVLELSTPSRPPGKNFRVTLGPRVS